MKKYHPNGEVEAVSNKGCSPVSVNTLSGTNVRSELSQLTASTLSITQSQQFEWPEFEENYNSIMDNTNVVDSCVAALNDITVKEEDRSINLKENQHNRSEMSNGLERTLASNGNICTTGNDFHSMKQLSGERIEDFLNWLDNIEQKVKTLPTVTKILSMNSDEMTYQLNVYSEIFKEIVARSCIVKNSSRKEYKAMEEKYHLLYLKVYEVLLLLEGLPDAEFLGLKTISNISVDELPVSNSSSFRNEICLDTEFYDKFEPENSTTIYTQTNVLSPSIGIYYFKHDDTMPKHTSIEKKPSSSSVIYGMNDKEITFESDLQTIFNVTDKNYLFSQDNNAQKGSQQQQQLLFDERVVIEKKNHISNESNCSDSMQCFLDENHFNSNIDYVYHKVRDWLYSKTDSIKSNSSMSLNCSMGSDTDLHLIYRTKSDVNLSVYHSLAKKNICATSFQTSLDCSFSTNAFATSHSSSIFDLVSEASLEWDNFQPDLKKSCIETLNSDVDVSEMTRDLCYFGEDYSLILESNLDRIKSNDYYLLEGNSLKDSLSTMINTENQKGEKTSHRRRKKHKKKYKNGSCSSVPMSSVVETPDICFSEATTKSASSTDVLSYNMENCHNPSSCNEKLSKKTINYNSTEKQFEMHSDDSNEPKKLEVSEVCVIDFFDIVKLCQNNVDCVITVLGAEPNRKLNVVYCKQMKYQRYQNIEISNGSIECTCKQRYAIDSIFNMVLGKSTSTDDANCTCSKQKQKDSCVCEKITHIISMILNFLADLWNIFRNMKLYTYLCRFIKALFGSTRYVADHLKMKATMSNQKALKYL